MTLYFKLGGQYYSRWLKNRREMSDYAHRLCGVLSAVSYETHSTTHTCCVLPHHAPETSQKQCARQLMWHAIRMVILGCECGCTPCSHWHALALIWVHVCLPLFRFRCTCPHLGSHAALVHGWVYCPHTPTPALICMPTCICACSVVAQSICEGLGVQSRV
jgi:hypothetical protein